MINGKSFSHSFQFEVVLEANWIKWVMAMVNHDAFCLMKVIFHALNIGKSHSRYFKEECKIPRCDNKKSIFPVVTISGCKIT